MKKILIVEDDLAFGTLIQTWLRKKGFVVERVTSVGAAVRQMGQDGAPDLVLSDLRLPDHDGLELLQQLRAEGRQTPFIVMTSYAEVQNAVLAMKSGANDYIAKPFQPDILLEKIREALAAQPVLAAPQAGLSAPAAPAPSAPHGGEEGPEDGVPRHIEGRSEASKKLYGLVALVAPTPMSVLILGESGTGKEYVARRIHAQSQRAKGPFVAIDCGAIPRDVAASELFGHVKGAFTGADRDKKGAFELADGGTLFLDEVGNLGYEVQVQLLRALQERRIRPVGSTQETAVDLRLVCATNEDLARRVADGAFREDLYHRINEFSIHMPPLRERGADLFLFADLFVRQANEELGRSVAGFDEKAAARMASYSWPGNLRELSNVVKRAVLMTKGGRISLDVMAQCMEDTTQPAPTALHDEHDERQRIARALTAAGGNKSKAALLLGIDRKTLYNKMRKYGIS